MQALIIDDEEDICMLLSKFLSRQSLHTSCSHSLKDGRQKLLELQPEILFLDNNLPDGSGIDSIPEIRALLPQLKIVVISALSNLREKAINSGANNFIDKPISYDSILALLQ